MNHELYKRSLELGDDWDIKDVVSSNKDETVEISLKVKPHSDFVCPKCGTAKKVLDPQPRSWRHIDTHGDRTYVVADVPDVECREHGIQPAAVPWANDESPYTTAFESVASLFFRQMDVDQVADVMGIPKKDAKWLQEQSELEQEK